MVIVFFYLEGVTARLTCFWIISLFIPQLMKAELGASIDDVKVSVPLSLLHRRCAAVMGTTAVLLNTSAMSTRPHASKTEWRFRGTQSFQLPAALRLMNVSPGWVLQSTKTSNVMTRQAAMTGRPAAGYPLHNGAAVPLPMYDILLHLSWWCVHYFVIMVTLKGITEKMKTIYSNLMQIS